jgi:hypothetical protein
MTSKNFFPNQDRRQFISRVMPACALSCSGCCASVLAVDQPQGKSGHSTGAHKFQNESCRTHEDAYRWRFGYFIDLMERFGEYLGREKLIEMIKRASDENNRMGAKNAPEFSFVEWINGGIEKYKDVMVWETVEKTDRVYEMRVTGCLWERIFRERKAGDIGYASVCHGDFSGARAAHPKIRFERTKTLMEGHDCCDHRWTWEA